MKIIRKSAACLLASGLACLLAGPAKADTIYDNSKTDLNTRFDPGTFEIGDEILLSGNARYLTNFSFEFWAVNSDNPLVFSGSPQARVRFYLNDGPDFNSYSTPSTVFFDSDWFSLGTPTERSVFEFNAGTDFASTGLFMPVISNMTWSVQFQGLGSTDSAGVDLYDPADVGANYGDYWQNDGGWALKTNNVPMNFAARFEASPTMVPEPALGALALLGGSLLLSRRIRA